MTIFLLIIHVIVCGLVVLIIMMQSGRGGGLTEGFGAAESMFGAKTNSVLVKATTVLAFIFLFTSVTLAFLSAQKDKSLLMQVPDQAADSVFDPDRLFDEAASGAQRIEIDLTGQPQPSEQPIENE